MFEGIAKTDTTYTQGFFSETLLAFEGIAKTDTTYTNWTPKIKGSGLRVLLKQTQLTQVRLILSHNFSLRVLLKQTQLTQPKQSKKKSLSLRVLLKQTQLTQIETEIDNHFV